MKALIALAMCALALGTLTASQAALVVFGDSLSGKGASALVSEGLSKPGLHVGPYPPFPYDNGRFSNGKLWPEVAAKVLRKELEDFATGGATSGAVPATLTVRAPFGYVNGSKTFPVPDLPHQVAEYLAHHERKNGIGRDLFAILIGADDYLDAIAAAALGAPLTLTPTPVIAAITSSLETLYNAGAKAIVLLNLPEVADVPLASAAVLGAQAPVAQAYLREVVAGHNAALAALGASFPATHPHVKVLVVDTLSFFSGVFANATQHGLTGSLTAPCYTGSSAGLGFDAPACAEPDTYVYWDGLHPTHTVHALFGKYVASQVKKYLPAFA